MKNTNSFLCSLLVLVLAILACTKAADVTPGASLPTSISPATDSTRTPLPTDPPVGLHATVLADLVNIRDSAGNGQGITAPFGTELVIAVREGEGWAVIISPAKWNGMKIWRGCTSEPGDFGCEASE